MIIVKKKNIHWFVSCWDNDSVDFILDYDTPCIKVASASITDYELLNYIKSTNLPVDQYHQVCQQLMK